MKDKAWAGRFRGKTDPVVDAFTSSLAIDRRLFRQDIRGSIAHARMLGRRGLISRPEARAIERGLREVEEEIASGRAEWKPTDEDVHMAVERMLTEKIGEAGGKLHTARSRNDQVATDLRLWVRDETDALAEDLNALDEAILNLAEKHVETVMPGYTHLQRAQPVSLAHHLLAYHEMLVRDRERVCAARARADELPLGSAALAGTGLPVDRASVARELGFEGWTRNSIDAVSDRDFAIDFVYACALLMTHLSRLAEELILWTTSEFSFAELPDAFATGSSIMPQKKNPDVLELIRGRAAGVIGDLSGFLCLVKGLPLAYNRDLQEDKATTFRTADTARASVQILARLLPRIRFHKEAMAFAAEGGFAAATDLADFLAGRGVPFREAHSVVGKLVRFCLDTGRTLDQLRLGDAKRFHPAFTKTALASLTARQVMAGKTSPGGTSPKCVRSALKAARRGRKAAGLGS